MSWARAAALVARAAGLAVAVTAAASSSSSCSPRNNGTLLVVRVDTDLGVPGELDRIAVDVTPAGHATTTDEFPVAGRAQLPATLGLRPSGTPSFDVEVTARGLRGATLVVSQTAVVRFVAREAQELTLLLSRDCLSATVCPAAAGTVCVAGGRCVAKDQVATLRPYVSGGADAGQDRPPGDDGGDGGGLGGDARDAAAREARGNAGQWTVVPSPASMATLNGVWPIDDGDVWVVGAAASAGVMYRWMQGGWVTAQLPPGTAALYGVWAAGRDDVWAVGVAGTILHLQMGVWTVEQLTAPTGTLPPTLTAVWGAGPNDVWVVGTGGTIVHAGTDARTEISVVDVRADLASVWGSAADEVWVVGTGGTVLRRTGTTWAAQAQGLTASALSGVWLSGRSDVWAVGLRTTLHFDGSTWTQLPTPLEVPLGIWGSAGDDVWSVGRSTAAGSPFISRFNGAAWVDAASPVTTPLQAVRGSSTSNVWAVGNGGVVLRLQGATD